MKVKVETVFDTETGEYEMKFNNLSTPGEAMEYSVIQNMLNKIHNNFVSRVDNPDDPESDLPEDFYHSTH